jgi:hypothetical protein
MPCNSSPQVVHTIVTVMGGCGASPSSASILSPVSLARSAMETLPIMTSSMVVRAPVSESSTRARSMCVVPRSRASFSVILREMFRIKPLGARSRRSMASSVQVNSFEPPSGTLAPAFWKALWSMGHEAPLDSFTCSLAWLTGQPPDSTSGALRPVSSRYCCSTYSRVIVV